MTAMSSPHLSAIFVTFHSRALIEAAIASTVAGAEEVGVSLEIVVVDNASGDGTVEAIRSAHPAAIVIANEENVGFGVANNQAFAVASGSRWLLLNPDARLAPGALPALLAAFDDDDRLGAAGPSITGAGTSDAESAGELPGLRSLAGHFLFLNRIIPARVAGPWRGVQLRRRGDRDCLLVGWVSGAAMVLRPDAIRETGGFDPSIFLYGEDMELGYRLAEAGWRLAVVPRAGATHAIGGSQGPGSTRWIDGIEGYLVRRGRSRPAIAAALAMIAAGTGVRWAIGSLLRHNPSHLLRLRASMRHAMARAIGRTVGGR